MKTAVCLLTFCLIKASLFAQSYEEAHAQFLRQVEERKVDSIYQVMCNVDETDPEEYEEIMVVRNQLGFLLNKTENLKKDIPAVLALPKFQDTGAYQRKVIQFQDMPPSEWGRFIDMCESLEAHFKADERILREVLMLKTFLEFMTAKTDMLLKDLPRLIQLFEKGTEGYYTMREHYANALIKSGELKKASNVFAENFKESGQPQHLHALTRHLANQENYKTLLKYQREVKDDTTNASKYFLGKAYLSKGKSEKALECFNSFIQNVEYNEPLHKVYHDVGIMRMSVDERALVVLGDFYAEIDPEKSCDLYHLAFEVVSSNESRERSFQSREAIIFDERKRKEMLENYEKDGLEREAIRKDVQEKLKGC